MRFSRTNILVVAPLSEDNKREHGVTFVGLVTETSQTRAKNDAAIKTDIAFTSFRLIRRYGATPDFFFKAAVNATYLSEASAGFEAAAGSIPSRELVR